MKMIHTARLPAERDRAWAFLMDIPQLASCIPGVETPVTPVDGGYQGVLKVRIGIISVRLEGKIHLEEQDPEHAPTVGANTFPAPSTPVLGV